MYNSHQSELAKLAKMTERRFKELSNKTKEYHELLQQDQSEAFQEFSSKYAHS